MLVQQPKDQEQRQHRKYKNTSNNYNLSHNLKFQKDVQQLYSVRSKTAKQKVIIIIDDKNWSIQTFFHSPTTNLNIQLRPWKYYIRCDQKRQNRRLLLLLMMKTDQYKTFSHSPTTNLNMQLRPWKSSNRFDLYHVTSYLYGASSKIISINSRLVITLRTVAQYTWPIETHRSFVLYMK